MSDNFVTWAEDELDRADLFAAGSDYEGMLGDAAFALVKVFSEQGHSGFSAQITAEIFARLAAWKPLTPITNDPDEWMDVEADPDGFVVTWQSCRQSSLFSEDGGITYYDLDERQVLWRRWLLKRTSGWRWAKRHEAAPA